MPDKTFCRAKTLNMDYRAESPRGSIKKLYTEGKMKNYEKPDLALIDFLKVEVMAASNDEAKDNDYDAGGLIP